MSVNRERDERVIRKLGWRPKGSRQPSIDRHEIIIQMIEWLSEDDSTGTLCIFRMTFGDGGYVVGQNDAYSTGEFEGLTLAEALAQAVDSVEEA